MLIQFILILLFTTSVLSDDTIKPKKEKLSHFYRDKFFLSQEGQSCSDITDHRKRQRSSHFCSIAAPEINTWTTLSFWGWDGMQGNSTGSVEIYSVSSFYDDNNQTTIEKEILQLKILVSNDIKKRKHKALWHREDFIIRNVSNVTELKVYYTVSGGKNHVINLRDVWIRPTDTVEKTPPPRYCSKFLYISSEWFIYIVLISYGLIFLFACFRTTSKSNRNLINSYFHSSLYGMIANVMINNYTNSYPGMRCKNDDYFITIVIVISLGVLLTWFEISNNEEEEEEDGNDENETRLNRSMENFRNMITNEEQRLTNTTNSPSNRTPIVISSNQVEVEVNVIQVATQNYHKKMNSLSSSSSNKIKVFNANGNECSICMEAYTIERPGVITECGHVWCSQCIKDICKMRPPHQTGLCPTCRSTVSLKNIVLYKVESTINGDHDIETGGGGGNVGGDIEMSVIGLTLDQTQQTQEKEEEGGGGGSLSHGGHGSVGTLTDIEILLTTHEDKDHIDDDDDDDDWLFSHGVNPTPSFIPSSSSSTTSASSSFSRRASV